VKVVGGLLMALAGISQTAFVVMNVPSPFTLINIGVALFGAFLFNCGK
jgi:hypothetical protein